MNATNPMHPDTLSGMTEIQWSLWGQHRAEQELTALGAAPGEVAEYLLGLGPTGDGMVLQEMTAAAISQKHRRAGLPDPVYSPETTAAMAQLAGEKDRNHPHNALTLRCQNVALLAARNAGDGPAKVRAKETALLIMLLRESEMTSNELAHLTYADIVEHGGRSYIRTRHYEPEPVTLTLARTAAELGRGRENESILTVRYRGITAKLKCLTAAAGLGTGYCQAGGPAGALADVLTYCPDLPHRDGTGSFDVSKTRELARKLYATAEQGQEATGSGARQAEPEAG